MDKLKLLFLSIMCWVFSALHGSLFENRLKDPVKFNPSEYVRAHRLSSWLVDHSPRTFWTGKTGYASRPGPVEVLYATLTVNEYEHIDQKEYDRRNGALKRALISGAIGTTLAVGALALVFTKPGYGISFMSHGRWLALGSCMLGAIGRLANALYEFISYNRWRKTKVIDSKVQRLECLQLDGAMRRRDNKMLTTDVEEVSGYFVERASHQCFYGEDHCTLCTKIVEEPSELWPTKDDKEVLYPFDATPMTVAQLEAERVLHSSPPSILP